jgi:DNA-binding NarL/FixJ family response regulator
MNINATLTYCEKEAVMYLVKYEVIKIAASKRCVSEHTQRNQIKSAMSKLGAGTQIGLVKEFLRMLYGVRFEMCDARQMLVS